MKGRFSVKAILIGALVQTFSGPALGAVVLACAAARGVNLRITVAAFYHAPFFIPAIFVMIFLSSLLGGYVTGTLAPGAEMKNAAAVAALLILISVATHWPGAMSKNGAAPF